MMRDNNWRDGAGWGTGAWATMIGIVLLVIAVTLLVVYLLRYGSNRSEAHASPAARWASGPPQAAPPMRQANVRESAREIGREE